MKLHYMAEKIPYDRLLDSSEGIVRLRAGGTLVGFEITGPGHETMSADDVLVACERFNASLMQFTTGDFIHVVAHHVKATDYHQHTFPGRAAQRVDAERAEQFAAARYYVNRFRLYIGNQDESALTHRLKELFFGSAESKMAGDHAYQMGRFFGRVRRWQDAIGPVLKPRRLSDEEMFRDLLLCVNGVTYPAPRPASHERLYHLMGQFDLVGGSHPRLGELYMRPVSLIYPWPECTSEQALATLLVHPGELMLSARFICLSPLDAEKRVGKHERTHFEREKMGTGLKQWAFNAFGVNRRRSLDKDLEEQIDEIDETIAELPKGMPLGYVSIVAIPRGPDENEVNSRAHELIKDLAALGHNARFEDAAAVDLIERAWPGQGGGEDRRPALKGANFSELVMPVEHFRGTEYIDSSFFPQQTPVPLVVSGTGTAPFYVPAAIRGVGHFWVVGPTTGGKSTLLGVMILAYSGLEGARIIFLDRDYSGFVLTHAMGGTHVELAADERSPLCPFQTIDAADGSTFLFDFFTRLLARWDLKLNARQAADLRRAVELARDHGIRTMTGFVHLLHEPAVAEILQNYVHGAQWGHIFDGEPRPDTGALLTTYEMKHLDILGDRASGPAQELIIREIEATLDRSDSTIKRPTIVIADEASFLLRPPITRQYIAKMLRTGRKYNLWFGLATQSLQEIDDADIRSLLLESTAIKIFLPNRAAQGIHVRALYEMTGARPKEIDQIAEFMIPQRDYLCSTEYGSRCFRLDLGPIGLALAGSTGADAVAKARHLLDDYPHDQFLDRWLHLHGLGPAPTERLITPVSKEASIRGNGVIHEAA